jgi:D-alanine-D-alanine ligase
MQPGVVFGGPSPEHDISVLTGLQAARALADRGNDVVGLYWSKEGDWYRVDATSEAGDFLGGPPRSAEAIRLEVGSAGGFVTEGRLGRRSPMDVSAVVNCCHGSPGEDGTLQSLFDLAGVRYTGPNAPGAALGMDKLAFGAVIESAGLPSLPRVALTTGDQPLPFEAPYIVKPRFGGSSIGIEVVENLDTARALLSTSRHLRDGAVIEPYRLDADDLNICVRTHPTVQLSAIERPVRGEDGRIYSYAEKYLHGGEGMASAPRELPADLPDEIADVIRDAARRIVEVTLVRSVARIDFLRAGDAVYVNEINTIPGALGWYFWAHEGVPFGELLESMLDEATEGPNRSFHATGADGTALRSAGSIAGKLG